MTPDPVPPARRDEGEPIESLMPDADELRVEETLRGYLQGLRTAIHRPGTKTVEVERRIDEIVELVLGLLRQSRAAESAAFARGRAEGIEEAANALQPWVDDPKGAGMRAGPGVPPSIRHWARYMQDAIRALLGGADRGTPK